MTNKTQLPVEVEEGIKTEAKKQAAAFIKKTPKKVITQVGIQNICAASYGAGATKYATILHDTQQENKEWKEECERLAKLVEFWQGKYNELKCPSFAPPKIDNNPIA